MVLWVGIGVGALWVLVAVLTVMVFLAGGRKGSDSGGKKKEGMAQSRVPEQVDQEKGESKKTAEETLRLAEAPLGQTVAERIEAEKKKAEEGAKEKAEEEVTLQSRVDRDRQERTTQSPERKGEARKGPRATLSLAYAEEDAEKKAEEDARKKAGEDVRKKAEEKAKYKVREDAREKAEEEAMLHSRVDRDRQERTTQTPERETKARKSPRATLSLAHPEEDARKKAGEDVRKKAEEKAKYKAREDAREKAEEKAMLHSRVDRDRQERTTQTPERETKARKSPRATLSLAHPEEDAKKKAQEKAKNEAKENARKKAEEDIRKKAEEDARKKAEEEARKKAEQEAKKKAEEEKKKQHPVKGAVKVGSPKKFSGGKMDKGAVEKLLKGKRDDFGKCQVIVARKNPDVAGKLVLVVTVQPSGAVKVLSLVNTTGEKALESCVSAKIRQYAFPKPEGGPAEFEVSIQFQRL